MWVTRTNKQGEGEEAVPIMIMGYFGFVCRLRRPQNKEPNCYEPLVVRVLIVADPARSRNTDPW